MIEANPEYLAGYLPVITSGILMVTSINVLGEETPLRFAGPGTALIEMYFDSPVMVYALTPHNQYQYQPGTPEVIGQAYLEAQEGYARRIRATAGHLIRHRLLHLLAEFAALTKHLPEHNQDVMLTQTELAGIIHTTREKIGKCMLSLERQGVIRSAYGRFTIQNPLLLQQLVAEITPPDITDAFTDP